MMSFHINAMMLTNMSIENNLLQVSEIESETHVLVYRTGGEIEGYAWEPKWSFVQELMEDEEGLICIMNALKELNIALPEFWHPSQCVGCPHLAFINSLPICKKEEVCVKPYNI